MAAKDQALAPGAPAESAPTNWLIRRLPLGVVETLSTEQRDALLHASGDTGWTRPPVNIRVSLPFINRRFYITVVSGPELRSAGRRADERHRYPLRTAANVFFFVGLATIFYMVALVVLAVQSAIVEF